MQINKNRVFVLASVIATALTTSSSVCAEDTSVPVAFENALVNVGELPQGKLAEAVFRLKNSGAIAVTISDIKASCRCTAADVGEKKVAPGVTRDIRITVDTRGKSSGKFDEKILLLLEYGDKTLPIWAQVTGMVSENGKLKFTPGVILLDDVEQEERFSRTVKISRIGDKSTDILKVETPVWMNADTKVEKEGEWTLVVTGKTPAECGRMVDKVVVLTSSEEFPRIEIPLVVYVTGPVKIVPSDVVWLVENDEEKYEAKIVSKAKKSISTVVFDAHGVPPRYKWDYKADDGGKSGQMVLMRENGYEYKDIESWTQKITMVVDGKKYDLSVNVVVINKTKKNDVSPKTDTRSPSTRPAA